MHFGMSRALHRCHLVPGQLVWARTDQLTQLLHAGTSHLAPLAFAAWRLPATHPKRLIEAFANLYRALADAVVGQQNVFDTLLPGFEAGGRGMALIETAIASSAARTWRPLEVPG